MSAARKIGITPRTVGLSITGIVAALLIVAGFFFCPFHKEMKDQALSGSGARTAPVAEADRVAAAGDGTAPSQSGEAPSGNDAARVEVPADKQRLMGIRTSTASVVRLKKTLRTVGRVEVDEKRITTVNMKVEGWVDTLHVAYAGQRVKKGMALAEIYSPELMALQLELLNLTKLAEQGARFQRNIEFAWGDRYGTTGKLTTFDIEGLFRVARQKLSLWEIPEEQIKLIEETKTAIRTVTVRSPATGYVFQKPVVKGTRVSPGEKLFDIVDLSTVWILADIYEYEVPFLKVGQNARIMLSYYPEKVIQAKVDFVYPSLSGQTRTMKARFVVPNPDGLLKPQMFANVEMEIDMGERLAIPETAVLDTGTRQVVYVDVGDEYFSPRQVKLGAKADGMVEVLSGLSPREKVASSGVFLIDSDAKLRGVSR